jgi:DNA-binding GntR family transcriptional regulator
VEYGSKQIERINAAIEGEAAAVSTPEPADFAHANEKFRRAVFDGISNQVLWGLISQFANHLNFIRATTLRNLSLRREIVDRQREICNAIASRDERLAEDLWQSYLRFTEKSLVSAMNAPEPQVADADGG